VPNDERSLVDRFVDGIYRAGRRRIESSRTATAMCQRTTRRPDPLLARFGQRHPILGGSVAALVFGTAMFVVFSVPVVWLAIVGVFSRSALLALELVMAVLWAIGGMLFGLSVGRTWSRGER
jgi:hypothetical protein